MGFPFDKLLGNKRSLCSWATGTAVKTLFPLAGFLAKGVVWTMDGEQCPRDGTYRRGGRLTYYGPAPDHLSDARLPGGGHAALAAAAAFAFGGAGPMGHTWQAFALSFEAAVEGHDVTKAWQVLSAAAEEVMAGPGGSPSQAKGRAGPGMVQDRHRRLPEVAAKLARDIETFGDDYPRVLHVHSYIRTSRAISTSRRTSRRSAPGRHASGGGRWTSRRT